MKDFIHRTITAEKMGVKVSRMRDSHGFEQITVSNNFPTYTEITFSRSSDDVAKIAPVEKLRDLRDLIDQIINDPCTLPLVPEVKYAEGKL